MSEVLNIYNHIEKALEEVAISRKIKEAQKKWSKVKGYFIVVPDYAPRTELFIREGQDIGKKIKEFKKKRNNIVTINI